MIAVDTNVLVAGLLSWHEFHRRGFQALEKALKAQELVIPLPVLIESYSVMTRLPSPYRLRPDVARQLLHESFGNTRVVSLSVRKAWTFLEDCVTYDMAGGRVYDALVALAAVEAGARVLLTFNPRDFETFRDRIEIVEP